MAVSDSLAAGGTLAVRVLAEDLVLYRGDDGVTRAPGGSLSPPGDVPAHRLG